MLCYCLKCKKKKKILEKKPEGCKGKKRLINGFIKCGVCNSKKLRFLKEQEASGILGNMLGTKTLLLGDMPTTNEVI